MLSNIGLCKPAGVLVIAAAVGGTISIERGERYFAPVIA
jgi:hypothetical protein